MTMAASSPAFLTCDVTGGGNAGYAGELHEDTRHLA